MSALRERTDMTRDARSAHDLSGHCFLRRHNVKVGGHLAAHSSATSVRLYAPAPTRASLPEISWPRYQGRLFRCAHKQGAGQFAVFTDERCVVGLVVFTKNGRWPGVGLFFDQGFVGRAIWLQVLYLRRIVHCSSRLFRFEQNPYRHKKGYSHRVWIAPMKRCFQAAVTGNNRLRIRNNLLIASSLG